MWVKLPRLNDICGAEDTNHGCQSQRKQSFVRQMRMWEMNSLCIWRISPIRYLCSGHQSLQIPEFCCCCLGWGRGRRGRGSNHSSLWNLGGVNIQVVLCSPNLNLYPWNPAPQPRSEHRIQGEAKIYITWYLSFLLFVDIPLSDIKFVHNAVTINITYTQNFSSSQTETLNSLNNNSTFLSPPNPW